MNFVEYAESVLGMKLTNFQRSQLTSMYTALKEAFRKGTIPKNTTTKTPKCLGLTGQLIIFDEEAFKNE